MSKPVHCRLCGKDILKENTDWVCTAANFYYHTKCWAEWKDRKFSRDSNEELEEKEWFDLLKDYVWRDIHMTNPKFDKITNQWKHFLHGNKYHFTAKGIYFAVLYFYEIMHGNSEKADGGIGIVPFIYTQSAQYWIAREEKQAGFMKEVTKQMAERNVNDALKFDPKTKARRKPKWNMEDL